MASKKIDVNIETTNPDIAVPITGDMPREDFAVQEVEICANIKDFGEKAATLAFMEEPVTIHIHESTDPNAERAVFCAVNGEGALGGKSKWLPRGHSFTVKRKFVAQLLTARPTSFTQPFKDDTREERVNFLRPHTAMRYPFTVERDDNPKGHAWLKQMLGH